MRRKSVVEWIWEAVQRGERRIIRVMVLASVILVLMQLSAVRDPLQFYMAVTSRVEAPPLDLPMVADSTLGEAVQTWLVTLKATPAAPIRVLQNGKVIASLAKGQQQIAVQAGQIQLDATGLNQIVRVQILTKDSQLLEPRINQMIILKGNRQAVSVKVQH